MVKPDGNYVDDDGDLVWVVNGKWHRTDGPAIEFANGDIRWWLNEDIYEFDDWLTANTAISEEQKVMLKLQYG